MKVKPDKVHGKVNLKGVFIDQTHSWKLQYSQILLKTMVKPRTATAALASI